jgi:predicted transcriptional regulator
MTERNRDDQGRFSAHCSDREVIEAVRKHEPAATSEVAEELDIERQSADYRLRNLYDEEEIDKKKIGASLVWFTVENSDNHPEE